MKTFCHWQSLITYLLDFRCSNPFITINYQYNTATRTQMTSDLLVQEAMRPQYSLLPCLAVSTATPRLSGLALPLQVLATSPVPCLSGQLPQAPLCPPLPQFSTTSSQHRLMTHHLCVGELMNFSSFLQTQASGVQLSRQPDIPLG